VITWSDVADPANLEATARALAAIEVTDPHLKERAFQEKLRDLTSTTRHVALYPTMRCLAARFKPRRYLEVGIFRAFSTVVVADGWPACDIVGVDDWSNEKAVTPVEAERRVKASGHAGKLLLLSGDSRRLVKPELGVFDLILVDGGHSIEVMSADLTACAPLLAPGGHLIAHDIFASFAPARETLWRAFQEGHPTWEWFEHKPAPGIGIGERPK